MQTTSVSEIQISLNRQRREFEPEALMALTESIRERGLLHAPVCRLDTNNVLVLVAGERRLRAIKMLWELGGTFKYNGQPVAEGQVPYALLGDLDALAVEEAELEENTIRQDLSWQERADAILRLTNLRRAQAKASGAPTPTHVDIAEELTGTRAGSKMDAVRKTLIVAQHMADPDVRSARTSDEAFKILKQKEEVKRNAELATTVGKNYSSTVHTLLNLSLSADPSAQLGSFDVILTDPPYGMGAHEFNDAGGALAANEHQYEDSYESWKPLMTEFVTKAYSMAKPQAHLYMFCDIDRFAEIKSLLGSAGWWVHRTPLLWHKPQAHRVPWPEHGPRRQYELIAYAVKGKRPTLVTGSDVLTFPSDENLGHPAQKPVALLVELLRRSARPGDTVLDAFAGTGSIFPAAHFLKLLATGYEINPSSYAIGVKRLQQLDNQSEIKGL